jgi:hypothetical protein
MWSILFALPNLNIRKAIGNDFIAIAPQDDIRIREIIKKFPLEEAFIENWENQFGTRIVPSFLIVKRRTPTDPYSIICYRNAFALSTIIRGYEHGFAFNWKAGPLYSDYFDFYPITFSKGTGLFLSDTPDGRSINYWDQPFKGQTSPGLTFVGKPLQLTDNFFICLETIWKNTFIGNKKLPEWPTLALFRSLEMAYRATAMPIKNRSNISDIGANASLWVSAFEILTHPGGSDEANCGTVLDLLEEYNWYNKTLKGRRYILRRSKRGKVLRRGTLAQKIYCELNATRNDFLHGNPIDPKRLYPYQKRKAPLITSLAPLIYKVALLAYLEQFNDPKAIGRLKKKGLTDLSKIFEHPTKKRKITGEELSDYLIKVSHDRELAKALLKAKPR